MYNPPTTCKDLVNSIVNGKLNAYSMEVDDARKLVAIAYYMGRESATKEISDKYNALIKSMRRRAKNCRYKNMAQEVIGDTSYIYSPDYAGDMTSMFGKDPTKLTLEQLAAINVPKELEENK